MLLIGVCSSPACSANNCTSQPRKMHLGSVRRLTTNFPCSRVHRFAGRRVPRRQLHNGSIVGCIEATLQFSNENFSVVPSRQRLLQEVQGINARRIVQSPIGADVCLITSSKHLDRRRLGPCTLTRSTYYSIASPPTVKLVVKGSQTSYNTKKKSLGTYCIPSSQSESRLMKCTRIPQHRVLLFILS